jgi:hypothetical protein
MTLQRIFKFIISKEMSQNAVVTRSNTNKRRLKLSGTHWLQAYIDDVNLLGDNINFIKKNTGTLIDAN